MTGGDGAEAYPDSSRAVVIVVGSNRIYDDVVVVPAPVSRCFRKSFFLDRDATNLYPDARAREFKHFSVST